MEQLEEKQEAPKKVVKREAVKREAVKREKKEKAVKAPKPIKKKMNVPTRIGEAHSLPWAKHVYKMIHEASPTLCKEEAVIDAYNAFVACLAKYGNKLYTYTPSAYDRYAYAIQVKITSTQIFCIQQNRRITHPFHGTDKVHIDATHELYLAYLTLYDLIKDTVVPYMQLRHKEENGKLMKRRYIHKIAQLKDVQHRYMEEYDTYRKQFQERMEYVQTELQKATGELVKLDADVTNTAIAE